MSTLSCSSRINPQSHSGTSIHVGEEKRGWGAGDTLLPLKFSFNGLKVSLENQVGKGLGKGPAKGKVMGESGSDFGGVSFQQVAFSFNGGKDSTVLLHLLRAGYFLYKEEMGSFNGNMDSVLKCPIRTIYFETSSAFPEINSFTYETAASYDLQLDIIRLDFKSGLETLLKEKPTKAIFLGTRIGDPNAIGQEQFSPSSTGWPPFMRVNPILDWSYRDVWAFILTCKVPYCSLYDKGYTSIGSIYDTEPNALLCIPHQSGDKDNFKPAYCLSDGRLERAGRAKKLASKNENIPIMSNGLKNTNPHQSCSFSASIIAVGDEILFGSVEEKIGATLCKKLYAIGWRVSHRVVVGNDIDLIADELEHRKCKDDLIFLFGALGPLHSDVSLAGVAKAFGVRLAPDEEFEEYLRHIMGNHGTGNRNEVETVKVKELCQIDTLRKHRSCERGRLIGPGRDKSGIRAKDLILITERAYRMIMALLPEGITELLHHDKLVVPLIKCCNVMLLSATNTYELEQQWDCLLQLCSSPLVQLGPFISKQLSTKLYDLQYILLLFLCVMKVEIAAVLSKLCLDFPDIHIGCHRQSRAGPLIINFVGKDRERIQLASHILSQKFDFGAFSELSSG
ncbi:hypothetical protein IEQ34_008802 [Dendrobium chrysotoxum]|uniref:FAD synthase n=2 Tax=Dendrobium TaxID=37818 RepID=A0AAV7GYW2_DENCH|nr:hypothetical protein IEQ34_008802 [Dendrobium chrysotoxum]